MTDDLHHLAAAYALDALDEHERAEFERHYPTCETCAAEVAEFRDVAAALAAAESVEPPPELRDRTLGEIERTPQVPPRVDDSPTGTRPPARLDDRRSSRWSRIGMAAAAAVLLILGALAVVRLGDEATTTDDIVSAPDAVVSTLESTDDRGVLQIVWSPERDQVALIGSGVEPVESGLAYALWFVLGDQVAPAALFSPDADGDLAVVLDVDDLDADGWGITVEPEGGSAQPTSPIIFSGSV